MKLLSNNLSQFFLNIFWKSCRTTLTVSKIRAQLKHLKQKYSQTCLSGHLSIAANLPIVTTKLNPMEAHYLYKNLYIAATCL